MKHAIAYASLSFNEGLGKFLLLSLYCYSFTTADLHYGLQQGQKNGRTGVPVRRPPELGVGFIVIVKVTTLHCLGLKALGEITISEWGCSRKACKITTLEKWAQSMARLVRENEMSR